MPNEPPSGRAVAFIAEVEHDEPETAASLRIEVIELGGTDVRPVW
jgi:hypothetical protein